MKRKYLVTDTMLEKAKFSALTTGDYVHKETYRRLKETYNAERKKGIITCKKCGRVK